MSRESDESERIRRLQDAIEGVTDGVYISAAQAEEVLAYVDAAGHWLEFVHHLNQRGSSLARSNQCNT